MAIKISSSFERSQQVAMQHFLTRSIRIEEILHKVGISDEEAAQGQHTEFADRLLRVITILYKTAEKTLKEVYQLQVERNQLYFKPGSYEKQRSLAEEIFKLTDDLN